MDDSKKTVNRYLLQCAVTGIVYLAAVVCLLWFYPVTSVIIPCVLLFIPVKFAILFFARLNFLRILNGELDSRKFRDAIYHKPMRPGIVYRLPAEMYSGNYAQAVVLSKAWYKSTRKLRGKIDALTYMARINFELRDFEKLKSNVNEFYELQKSNPNRQALFTFYSIFGFYKDFVNGDYEKCKSAMLQRLSESNQSKINLQFTARKFLYAVSCYESGDYDKATETFEYLLKTAPKMEAMALQSEKYLNAIRNDDKTVLENEELIVESESVEKETKAVKRKKLTGRIFNFILIALVLFVFGFNVYSEFMSSFRDNDVEREEYLKRKAEYEAALSESLSEHYEDFYILNHFNVKKNDTLVDNFVIVKSGDSVDVLHVFRYGGEGDLECETAKSGIEEDTYYVISSVTEEYYIGFTLASSRFMIPENAFITEKITVNGIDEWFCVDYIGTEKISGPNSV